MTKFEKIWSIYKGKGLARARHPNFPKSSHISYLAAYEDGTDSVFRNVGM